ncbi:MAG TPA: chemotaxis response regulator protein-glutamate methylesterase [Gammaproteobacteria bacterium]|nr:chemotaxis response regulator protein-glutamate methylesterase [Gammaproteobacteria bacterium]
MSIRVLVVDDSRFFRRRVTEMLESDPQIKVIGSAENGEQAVQMAQRLRPDIITMDVEMPIMDGITATRKIMASRPTGILMFSSLTTEGAQATLDALEAGAADFLPKRFEDISRDRDEARRVLCERVRAVGSRRLLRPRPAATSTTRARTVTANTVAEAPGRRAAASVDVPPGRIKLVAIGTSTGGPVALQQVLSQLAADFPLPLLLIQHMPGSFTTAFAQRLDRTCAIRVREAVDGDRLEPGLALLAPGGKQMTLEGRAGQMRIRISEPEPGQNYKPSVDVTFSAIARQMAGQALAVVLTGMGADGREGAKLMKQGGSRVWAQDEATSVVYGMPAAVVDAGITEQVLPLEQIGHALARIR